MDKRRMKERRPEAVLIAGPTASGKTALALRVAQATDGVVINADSMQVYRELRVITARPTPDEEAQAPHRLYGHVDAGENYSTGRWLTDVADVLTALRSEGRLAIIVGGTGLYFKLLTSGIATVPPIATDVRNAIRARLEAEGPSALHRELAALDVMEAARIHPSDGSRLVRALEVIVATGRPLRVWQETNSPPLIEAARVAKVFLAPDRDALRARIDERFDIMLAAGALQEVRALAARDLAPRLPAMKAHGVPWLIRHLRGEISLEEATIEAKADTRRYAKRQFTWFRNQMLDWSWEEPAAAYGRLMSDLLRQR